MQDDANDSKAMLVGFVNRVKSLADEIKDLQADISDVVKEAKSSGFDGTKIREVVRWLQKVDKHGREKVEEAEAIFDLYRAHVEGGGSRIEDMMSDARSKAILATFAPDDQGDAQLSRRRRIARTAATLARAAREARDA
jgi:uncharacterized protein (UPF0335 family)